MGRRDETPERRALEYTIEGYTKVAEQFKNLIPVPIVINYLRGWLE